MYLAARSWGVQPGEFWGMSVAEWMVEATFHVSNSDQARKAERKAEWLAKSELSDEEWWAVQKKAADNGST